MKRKTILVYSHDTYGLGNIRRMLAISEHLVESDPDLSLLIVSGSPMFHAFRVTPGIDYVKLPCLKRTLHGEYVVNSLGMNFDQVRMVRSELILSTVQHFEPDLILVDKKPFGVDNELHAALAWAHTRSRPPKLALLLRDILDAPEVTIPIWHKNGYYNAIRDLYNQVLVIGSRDVFDTASEYQFPHQCIEKVRFCGYLKRNPGLSACADTRARLGVDDRPLVLVTVGGGEDGMHVLDCYLEGLRLVQGRGDFQSLLVCGPEMPAANRMRLVQAGREQGVVIHEFTDDMMSFMEAADLVVSMGGYNTICEILTARKPAIVVPRIRPVKEQWIRAQRMAELGMLRTIHPDELEPRALMQAVREELDKGHPPASDREFKFDGLGQIGSSIAALLKQEQTHTPAIRIHSGRLS